MTSTNVIFFGANNNDLKTILSCKTCHIMKKNYLSISKSDIGLKKLYTFGTVQSSHATDTSDT